MAKGVNKVIAVRNVGQDPEVKYTASGVDVEGQWRLTGEIQEV